jgi:hypothetical protein
VSEWPNSASTYQLVTLKGAADAAYLATPQTLENPQDREMISQPA